MPPDPAINFEIVLSKYNAVYSIIRLPKLNDEE